MRRKKMHEEGEKKKCEEEAKRKFEENKDDIANIENALKKKNKYIKVMHVKNC